MTSTRDPTLDLFADTTAIVQANNAAVLARLKARTTTAPPLQSLWTNKRNGRTARVIRIDGEGRVHYWTLGPIIDAAYAREVLGEGSCLDAAAWHELFRPNERAEMLELLSMGQAAFAYLSFKASDCDRAQFKQRAERAWHAMCHARHDLPA